MRNTLILQGANGQDLDKIQENLLRIRDTKESEYAGGGTTAMIKKALITPLRNRFMVEIPGGED